MKARVIFERILGSERLGPKRRKMMSGRVCGRWPGELVTYGGGDSLLAARREEDTQRAEPVGKGLCRQVTNGVPRWRSLSGGEWHSVVNQIEDQADTIQLYMMDRCELVCAPEGASHVSSAEEGHYQVCPLDWVGIG